MRSQDKVVTPPKKEVEGDPYNILRDTEALICWACDESIIGTRFFGYYKDGKRIGWKHSRCPR